jgi:hypothetical protein
MLCDTASGMAERTMLSDIPHAHVARAVLIPFVITPIEPINPFLGWRKHPSIQGYGAIAPPDDFLPHPQLNALKPHDGMDYYAFTPTNLVVIEEASIRLKDCGTQIDNVSLPLLVFWFAELIRVPSRYLPYPPCLAMHPAGPECVY